MACDNIVVEWLGNGRDPGVRMAIGKRSVLLMKWQVGWLWPVTTVVSSGAAMGVILA